MGTTGNGGARPPAETVEIAGQGSFAVTRAPGADADARARRPALLVHGLGGGAAQWHRVLPLLAADRPVVAYDLRGHGATRAADAGRTLAAHAGDLLALAAALFPGERPHVLGTSLGGVVAQIAAAREPGAFASLVLACTWAEAPPGLDAEGMAAAIEAAPDLRAHFAGLVRAMLPGHPEEAALLLDAIAATEPATFAQGARELFAYSGTDLLPAITVPVLALCGADDDLFTLPAAQAIARGVRNGTAGAIGRAGHAPYLDRPQPFAAVVGEFWAGVDAG